MDDKEKVLQSAAETIPQLADALTSNTEAAKQLTWAYKEGMRECGYAVILAHCPVGRVEDLTAEHNLNARNPESAHFLDRFLRRLRQVGLMLAGCDDELPRA